MNSTNGRGRSLKAKDVAELLQTTIQEQEKYGSNPIDELLKYVDEMQRRNEVLDSFFGGCACAVQTGCVLTFVMAVSGARAAVGADFGAARAAR